MPKRRVHTTLSDDSYKILKRYEQETGSMGSALESALKNLDHTKYKGRIGVSDYKKTIRKTTGIEGLDSMMEAGIPEGFIVIVTGLPGTGKTTLAMQFLVAGIKNGERGIFFSFEEDAEQLANHCLRFGWNIKEYIDEGLLDIYGFSMLSIDNIIDIIDGCRPSRMVFDSINVLTDLSDSIRRDRMLRNMIRQVKNAKITTIITTEKIYGTRNVQFDELDFMGDGVIFLDKIFEKNMFILMIRKMRGTKIDGEPRPFEMTGDGIELYTAEVFDLPE
jgi:KaiC/GvpD/RAD55 family RecA-like ATPase